MNTDDLRRRMLATTGPDDPNYPLIKYAQELERDLVALAQRCVALEDERELALAHLQAIQREATLGGTVYGTASAALRALSGDADQEVQRLEAALQDLRDKREDENCALVDLFSGELK